MKFAALNLLALVLLQQSPVQPPALLGAALKTEPGVRLLNPATDLREYTQDALTKFGYWPPWLIADFDGDKRPDVAAVVVKPSPRGSEFGVIAVHARTPADIHWVVPLDADIINGVTEDAVPGRLIPLYCIECDSNGWFRWFGTEYEPDLYIVGEEVSIGSETQADLPLYSAANLTTKPTTTVPHCTTVVVRKVGGTPEKRWYFVETPEGQRGWVPDTVTSADVCVG